MDHDLNKIESILPKNASTQVTAFFLGPYGFWGEHFLKIQKKFNNSKLYPPQRRHGPSFE